MTEAIWATKPKIFAIWLSCNKSSQTLPGTQKALGLTENFQVSPDPASEHGASKEEKCLAQH